MDNANELHSKRSSGELWQRLRVTLQLWLKQSGCTLVLQQHRMDCALCCLTMVATFYAVPPALIRRHLLARQEFSLQGMTAAQIIQQARYLGLAGQVRQLELPQLVRLTRPIILWWHQAHFVVLNRNCTRSQCAEILDPARGRLLLPWSQLQLCYSGVSIMLSPTAEPSSPLF